MENVFCWHDSYHIVICKAWTVKAPTKLNFVVNMPIWNKLYSNSKRAQSNTWLDVIFQIYDTLIKISWLEYQYDSSYLTFG